MYVHNKDIKKLFERLSAKRGSLHVLPTFKNQGYVSANDIQLFVAKWIQNFGVATFAVPEPMGGYVKADGSPMSENEITRMHRGNKPAAQGTESLTKFMNRDTEGTGKRSAVKKTDAERRHGRRTSKVENTVT